MKILIEEGLPRPIITDRFWETIFNNGTTLLNDVKISKVWLRSLLKQQRTIKPKYSEIYWIKESWTYCIWVIDVNNIDIIDRFTWDVKFTFNIVNDVKLGIKNTQILWKYLVIDYESDYDPPKWTESVVWTHKIKMIDIETGIEKIIDDPECVFYNLVENNWRFFSCPDGWNYSKKYIQDSNLAIINIPEWYHSLWVSDIDEWMLKLWKIGPEPFVREVWSNNQPIWPYDWIWKFSEWKCLVYKDWVFSIIDKQWTTLFSIKEEWKWQTIINKRILNINNQAYGGAESNIFKDWKMILFWNTYDEKWDILFSFEWSSQEKQELRINSNANWILVWTRRRLGEDVEHCMFNENWKLLCCGDKLVSKNKILMKLDWGLLELNYFKGKWCNIYKDTDYLAELNFNKNKFLTASIELNWNKTKYIFMNEDNIDNIKSVAAINNLWIVYNDNVTDKTIEIKWKKFSKKFLKI